MAKEEIINMLYMFVGAACSLLGIITSTVIYIAYTKLYEKDTHDNKESSEKDNSKESK